MVKIDKTSVKTHHLAASGIRGNSGKLGKLGNSGKLAAVQFAYIINVIVMRCMQVIEEFDHPIPIMIRLISLQEARNLTFPGLL